MGTETHGQIIETQGACSDCKAPDSSRKPHAALVVFGNRVVDISTVGRGHEQTDYTFMQCSQCGSVWVKYQDSGAGGHGRFMKRLTAELY
jgi:hypothetical protein